jgi:peptidoglycan-associated lipoprotein
MAYQLISSGAVTSKQLRNVLFIGLASLMIFGCKGRDKSSSDTTTPDAGTTPVVQQDAAVDSSPMNFDAQGSDSNKISGLSTVFFDYDKSTLSSTSREALKGNAEWMKKNSKVSIQIEGHTDSRGSIEYNLALGERRANAVKSYLQTLGIPASRMKTISYGKERPLVQGETEEAWAKNRRANFVPVQ